MSNGAILLVFSLLFVFANGYIAPECRDCYNFCGGYEPTPPPSPPPSPPGCVCPHGPDSIPIYYLYIMISIMLLMILIILGLTIMICKDKCARKIFHTQETYVEFSKTESFIRQDSNDVAPLKIPFANNYHDSTLSVNTVAVDMVDMAQPGIDARVRKPTNVMKKPSPVKNILMQDTIEEICQKALKNSINESESIKHLDSLLRQSVKPEAKQVKESIDHEILQKCSSTPDLELYDSLPTPRKLGDYEDDEIYANTVYEYPKPRNEPVSEEETYQEPSYINATRYKFKAFRDEA